jgi:hypothetical protein
VIAVLPVALKTIYQLPSVGRHTATSVLALYQHSCHEVQSSCNALSVKELQQSSAIGLLPQQRMKSISAT